MRNSLTTTFISLSSMNHAFGAITKRRRKSVFSPEQVDRIVEAAIVITMMPPPSASPPSTPSASRFSTSSDDSQSRSTYVAPMGLALNSDEVMQRVEDRLGRHCFEEAGAEIKIQIREALREVRAPLTVRRHALHRIDDRSAAAATSSKLSWTEWLRFWAFRTYKKTLGLLARKGVSFWGEGDIKSIKGIYGTGVGTYFVFLRFMVLLNAFCTLLTISFLVIPQLLDRLLQSGEWVEQPYNGTAAVEDFFTGTGWLLDTELYYGRYSSAAINVFTEQAVYDMPSVYYYTMFGTYLAVLVVISVSMATSFRKNFIEAHGGDDDFCDRVFCGWDFAITQKKTAQLKVESLVTQLREALQKQVERYRVARAPTSSRVRTILVHVGVNLIVAAVLVGVGFLTDFLVDEFEFQEELNFLSQMALSLIVSGLLLLLPQSFSLLSLLERSYDVRKRVYVTLARTVALEVVVLGVMAVKYLGAENLSMCWEDAMASGMYRQLVAFFFIVVLANFLGETVRMFAYQVLGFKTFGAPKFDIARNTMHLIYAQTVTWIGLYFSPMLPLVLIIVLILTYYIKKLSLYVNCHHSRRPWRSAQSETVFKLFTFVSLIGTCIVYFYSMTSLHPSGTCGPFRDYSDSYSYDIMSEAHFFGFFIFNTSWVVLLIIALLVSIYYVRTLGNARKRLVKILKQRIEAEGTEKALLVHLMSEGL